MPTADELLNADAVLELTSVVDESVGGGPNVWPTVRATARELSSMTLSERARAVAAAILVDCNTYAELADITRSALGDPRLAGWMIWPLTEAVATAATRSDDPENLEDGLDLLSALTSRLTSEFALRIFLLNDVDRALAVITGWTTHDDPAVRRLASEGTRPKLPWARQVRALTTNPGRTRPILDALYTDEDPDVRRSVANHLNDISRLGPGLAVQIATGWTAQPDEHTAPLIRHAMRTLVKEGNEKALALLGFVADLDRLRVTGPTLDSNAIQLGESITWNAEIVNESPRPATIAIDYVIHHQKANGATSAKVFKLTNKTLAPGASVSITRQHEFKPISTRRYYSGAHGLQLQINGRRFGHADFTLTTPFRDATTAAAKH